MTMRAQWLSVGFEKWHHSHYKRKFSAVLAEFKFPMNVQCKFRQTYGYGPPDRHTAVNWQQHLLFSTSWVKLTAITVICGDLRTLMM